MTALGVDDAAGSLEGKEVRFGTGLSALWAVTTTVTSNGSVNAMHDSMTPLGGLMPLAGMWLNNIFGGVGVGFINMVLYLIVTVFVAGMMVGRTPEFLGKKVEAREVKLASLALLWHPLAILVTTAVACLVWAQTADPGAALGWLKNPGPHGFSEMLYEFTSAAANNGSGFEGLGDNTPFWNIATGMVMLLSRYIPIIAPVALVASLAAKTGAEEGAGSLRADSATFGVMLWSVTIILGLLMFLPAAVLGPIAEHLSQGVDAMTIDLIRGVRFALATMLLFGGAYPFARLGSGADGLPPPGAGLTHHASRWLDRRLDADRAGVRGRRVRPPAAVRRRLQRRVHGRHQLRPHQSRSPEGRGRARRGRPPARGAAERSDPGRSGDGQRRGTRSAPLAGRRRRAGRARRPCSWHDRRCGAAARRRTHRVSDARRARARPRERVAAESGAGRGVRARRASTRSGQDPAKYHD